MSTHSMFPGSANPSGFSPAPTRSPPPTLPPNPCSSVSTGVLVTLLLYAKKRHKLARSALCSIIAPPTVVLIKAVRKAALRSRSWDTETPPLLSVSTVVISMPGSMAPVPSAAKPSPHSVLQGTKTFPMPPLWASPQTTLQGPTVHPTVPATPARRGPRFPHASESTQPETVKLVRSASPQSNLVSPQPRRNLFGAGRTRFRARTGADWSGPAPPHDHMDL